MSASTLAAPSDAAFYRVVNQMIGELAQSHMMITGPGSDDEDDLEELAAPGESATSGPAAPTSGAVGDPGLTVRVIEGRPTITVVRRGSAAERAGLEPNHVARARRNVVAP